SPPWDLPWLRALAARLGFNERQARLFQALGCRDALLAIRGRFAAACLGREALPEHATAALRLVGGSWGDAASPGWLCKAERCSLRVDCDRVAASETEAKQTAAGAGTR